MPTPALTIRTQPANKRVTVPACVMVPCEWKRKKGQMFLLVAAVQVFEPFSLEVLDDFWVRGEAGDWILVGASGECVTFGQEEFSQFARKKQVKHE